tara:strand:- start:5 stop:313 length:309 start_codon:yes stop_codon:yes gene_type:complete
MNKYLIIVDVGLGRSFIAGTFDSMHEKDTALKQLYFLLKYISLENKKDFLKYLQLTSEHEEILDVENFQIDKDNGFIQMLHYEISLRKLSDYKNFNDFYNNN